MDGFWWFLHNAVAHMALGLTGEAPWAMELHDRTARMDGSTIARKGRYKPAGIMWTFHNSVAHALMAVLGARAWIMRFHDATAAAAVRAEREAA